MSEINHLRSICQAKPKHWTRIVKKDQSLLDWVDTQCQQFTNLTLPEKVAYLLTGQEPYCQYNQKKKFASINDGFRGCGTASSCQCVRESVSANVSASKSQLTPEEKQQSNTKRNETNLKKYGVINQGQRQEVQERQQAFYQDKTNVAVSITKYKQTMLDKHGVTNPAHLAVTQEKKKQTNLEKYGVANPMMNAEVAAKSILTRKELYDPIPIWSKNYDSFKNKLLTFKLALHTKKEEYKGIGTRPIMKFECIDCNNAWEQRFDYANFPICRICHPSEISYKSGEELELFEFIKELGLDVVSGDKRLINPFELDIVIPSKKIAIEYNGLYWHSELSSNGVKKFSYHKNKLELCGKKEYRLISIFSDEWLDKREIVKSMLTHVLGKAETKIYARNCKVQLVKKDEANLFYSKTHLLGSYLKKSIDVGLYLGNELVACMCFDLKHELVRYSTAHLVVGGASRLLNFYINNYSPKEIISFSDNRFSTGDLYKKLGFIQDGVVPPMQSYVFEYKTRYHKLKFEKKKLIKEGYDPSKTEWEIMQERGFDRIWDCGKIKWKYVCK